MELIDLRRRLMSMAAEGLTPLSGEFTPTANVGTWEIDPGRPTTCLVLQERSGVLQSGTRNFAYCVAYENNGTLMTYASASNAGGTSWGGVWQWSTVLPDNSPVTKAGNVYTLTLNTFSRNLTFLAGVTYEWFAI